MTDKARIRIAAIATALFLAGISTAGVALHQHAPVTAGAVTSAPAVQQPAAVPGSQLAGDEEYEGDGNSSQEESD